MDLEGKVALVTGGGTGLGKEISLQLARAGCHVAVNYSRSAADAEGTADAVRGLGCKGMTVKADVAVEAEVRAMTAAVDAELGRLDILICNAGTTVFKAFKDLEGISEADWDRIFAVNVKGAWLCARSAAPYMRKQGGGRIVTTSSVAGHAVTGSSLAYSVSKAAMIHLTRGLAVALAPDNILVNSVSPGLLETRWIAGFSEQQKQHIHAHSPLGRIPSLADTAALTVHFCRTDSITGEAPIVDAGRNLV